MIRVLLIWLCVFPSISFAQQAFVPTAEDQCKPLDYREPRYTLGKYFPQLQGLSQRDRISFLLVQLDSADLAERIKAGIALKHVATTQSIPRFADVLMKGNNDEKQIAILETMARLKDPRVGRALQFEVKRGNRATKNAALTTLGKLQISWPVSILAGELVSRDDDYAKTAASALAFIGSEQAKYALRDSLSRVPPGAVEATKWALDVAEKKIDVNRIDRNMPAGQKLTLFYKGTRYQLYHPTQRKATTDRKTRMKPRILVCVHDEDLRTEDLFEECWKTGRENQFAVLVPFFDAMRYPEYGSLNLRGERPDVRLLEIVEHVGKYAKLERCEIYMMGLGMGGDFVQRFTMVHPNRIARSAFSADNFTMYKVPGLFPDSVIPNPLAPDIQVSLYDFVKADFAVAAPFQKLGISDADRFIREYASFAEQEGMRTRMAVRKYPNSKRAAIEEMLAYIFSEN